MLFNVFSQPTEIPSTSETPSARGSQKILKSTLSLADVRHQALLITQSGAIIETLQQVLKEDFKIIPAANVQDGIRSLTRECPDIILCDLKCEVAHLIEALKRAELCDVPLLILGTEEDRRKAILFMDQGASDVITLPFEATEVQARMNNYLQIYLAKRTLKSHFKCQSQTPTLALLAQSASVKAHELDRTNKMKDEFLAMLSHELRNPINVISGFAEVLVDNSEDAELAKEAAETIYRNAQFQAKLVQDLMDVSRSMNGKMILDCRPVELDFLLEEMLPSVETAAQKKNIHVQTHFNCTGLISGDSTRITQVIWNLITNAIKFTPEGGRVEIELRQKEEWVELLVRDTGIGIDPVFLPQIFEQFHQQDTNITKRFGGLGLGLTIVKNIIELHRGQVHAFSEGVGHGSTFLLQLPALPS